MAIWYFFLLIVASFVQSAYVEFAIAEDRSSVVLHQSSAELRDDISTESFTDPDETEIQQLFIKKFQRSWKEFDRDLLRSLLDAEFEMHYTYGDGKIYRQNRRQYLAKRRGWNKRNQSEHRDMRLSSPKFAKNLGNGSVVSLLGITSLVSEYFNPKFLSKYDFVKRDTEWRLLGETHIQLFPKELEFYEAVIAVGKPVDAPLGHLKKHQMMTWVGADSVVHEAVTEIWDEIPRNATEVIVFVLFREPPSAGSKISIEYTYSLPKYGVQAFNKQEVTLTNGSPWFFIERTFEVGGETGSRMTISASIDGRKIVEKQLNIR